MKKIIIITIGLILISIVILIAFIVWNNYSVNIVGEEAQNSNYKATNIEMESEHVKPKIIPLYGNINNSRIIWPDIRSVNAEIIDIKAIETLLSYKAVIGETLEHTISNYEKCECGVIGVDYRINYDKNNVLDISFFIETIGAYPDSHYKHYQIDLARGELIKIDQIMNFDKLNELVALCDLKLQNNIRTNIKNLKQKDISLLPNEEYSFKVENLDEFTINEKGITFYYNFGFPHVIKSLEPKSSIALSYEELNDFILENGYLKNMKK
jgi:hypothetical protein